MSEEPGAYNTQGDNAAEIHPPKTIQVIQDKGLVEYRVWGWVKISAKFISHIKRLRGAKLSIWQVLACSIDENGKCSLTIKELCELTGYSHTEVLDSLKELDEMGYLSIDRSGKKNLYTPEFAARGIENSPSETLVKKLDSTPAYQVESSPSLEKSTPSIKELKELIPNSDKNYQKFSKKVTDERREMLMLSERIAATLGITPDLSDKNWEKTVRQIVRHEESGQKFEGFVKWLKSGNDYNRPKTFQLAKNPKLILTLWAQAFMSVVENATFTRNEDGSINV